MQMISLKYMNELEQQAQEKIQTVFGDMAETDNARKAKETLQKAAIAISLDEMKELEQQAQETENSV